MIFAYPIASHGWDGIGNDGFWGRDRLVPIGGAWEKVMRCCIILVD